MYTLLASCDEPYPMVERVELMEATSICSTLVLEGVDGSRVAMKRLELEPGFVPKTRNSISFTVEASMASLK
jgi:hypothetical protein